ncbi:hypothetical protein SLA2020_250460 [Shorea laevis]
MASSAVFRNLCFISSCSPLCFRKNRTLALTPSPFHTFTTFLRLKKQTHFSNINFSKPICPKRSSTLVVYAAQSNFLKALQTVWKVGKDGIEAGMDLVPDSVPRPIARISVTIVAVSVALFVLKSFLSTAFFVLAMMGLIYFTFIALNKDQGSKGGRGSNSAEGPLDDPVEEARRIMEKYK